MADYDYIIAGSGAAGCVLAYRLSENPANRVLVLEAGPRDSHPLIHMPKGIAKVMADPKHIWAHESRPEASTANKPEYWARGKVLGGSTSINGMMYVRGMPADFDGIAELSSEDWGWEHIGKAYAALESHELGAAETRGASGPIHITLPTHRDALSEAQIAAGHTLGWGAKRDMNQPDDAVAIGYAPRTVYKGKRESAAKAFLKPAMAPPNLTVMTDAVVDKVLFDGQRAVGVRVIVAGSPREILIEHRAILIQSRLKADISHNKQYGGWRVIKNALKYFLGLDGLMSAASYEIVGWLKTDEGQNRPNAQILVAPFSFNMEDRTQVEKVPGMHVAAYDQFGTCGYHAVGSCRMGKDEASVVDPALRVRGVTGLRVMDTAIMPVIPSGNTNGPTMAMAWRAADIILRP